MITTETLAQANYKSNTIPIHGKNYVMVVDRVQGFRTICPAGTIDTTIIDLDDEHVVMQAKIYDEKDHLLASGTAEEKKSASRINETSYVENCETSAVGRALGMLGIGAEENMATADEVANAIMNQVELPTGKRALRVWCSEHGLKTTEVYKEHDLTKDSADWEFYTVLAHLMMEQA